jgi:hypothetical protein
MWPLRRKAIVLKTNVAIQKIRGRASVALGIFDNTWEPDLGTGEEVDAVQSCPRSSPKLSLQRSDIWPVGWLTMKTHPHGYPYDNAHENPVSNICIGVGLLVNSKVQYECLNRVRAGTKVISSNQAVDSERSVSIQRCLQFRSGHAMDPCLLFLQRYSHTHDAEQEPDPDDRGT